MNNTELVIETMSLSTPLIIAMSVFLLLSGAFIVNILKEGRAVIEGVVMTLLSGVIGVFVYAAAFAWLDVSHKEDVVHEIEQYYGIDLYDTEGTNPEDSRSINLKDTGYTPVHFNYGGDLFTDARLDKVEAENDSIKYTLMVDVDSNSSENMEEFSVELLDNVDTEDSMQEADIDSN